MSQIRYDLFHDRYVIIAPERMQRPGFLQPEKMLQREVCPFCEGREALTPPEIYAIRPHGGANGTGWKTRVVPNLYRALEIEAPLTLHKEQSREWREGFGAHEIVIDMPRHEQRMDQWSEREFFDWLSTLQERVSDLHRDFRLVYLSIFKNHGVHAGATQSHPHTQIIALPQIPKMKMAQIRHHVRYFHEHRRSIGRTLLEEALEEKWRVILQNDTFVAISPFAAGVPFEVWVTPKTPISSIIRATESDLHRLSSLLKTLFEKLYGVLGDFDFNLSFETAPLQKDAENEAIFETFDEICRFGIRILPRITGIGGFELSTGMMINPVTPELAAQKLREGRP
ncbi:MAG: hypothetical protein B6D59_06055 [Campylobacteraceae bacterium 4484_4]|nr:MAG: hypothetical protein B6D59_06055 [Campylobacteraceae bacterium 4484_4]